MWQKRASLLREFRELHELNAQASFLIQNLENKKADSSSRKKEAASDQTRKLQSIASPKFRLNISNEGHEQSPPKSLTGEEQKP